MPNNFSFVNLTNAEVAKLVDAHVSGTCVCKDMRVRVPPSALFNCMPRWRNLVDAHG